MPITVNVTIWTFTVSIWGEKPVKIAKITKEYVHRLIITYIYLYAIIKIAKFQKRNAHDETYFFH